MPERNFDALNGDRREQAAGYVPEYDWIPGRFGPPPGITKDRKEQFEGGASSKDDQSVTIGVTDSITQPGRINVVELITKSNLSEQEGEDLVDALRCKKCRKNMSGAVVLPCGCYSLCQYCSKGKLPTKCPACGHLVKEACNVDVTTKSLE